MADELSAIPTAKLIARLLDVGGTYEELIDYTGLGRKTVERYVRALRETTKVEKKRRLAIVGWAESCRPGRFTRPVFHLGELRRDKPRPRMTGAERAKRYREGLKLKAARRTSVFDIPTVR